VDTVERYLGKMEEVLGRIREEEKDSLAKAAELISEAGEDVKLIHVFGTGAHPIPVVMSAHVAGGDEINIRYIEKYFPVRHLY